MVCPDLPLTNQHKPPTDPSMEEQASFRKKLNLTNEKSVREYLKKYPKAMEAARITIPPHQTLSTLTIKAMEIYKLIQTDDVLKGSLVSFAVFLPIALKFLPNFISLPWKLPNSKFNKFSFKPFGSFRSFAKLKPKPNINRWNFTKFLRFIHILGRISKQILFPEKLHYHK